MQGQTADGVRGDHHAHVPVVRQVHVRVVSFVFRDFREMVEKRKRALPVFRREVSRDGFSIRRENPDGDGPHVRGDLRRGQQRSFSAGFDETDVSWCVSISTFSFRT